MKAAPPKNGSTYTEEDWNETSTLKGGEAYWVGKTSAERVAWEVAGAAGLELVTILPEFIMGPLISSRADGTSVGYMKVGGEFLDCPHSEAGGVHHFHCPQRGGRYDKAWGPAGGATRCLLYQLAGLKWALRTSQRCTTPTSSPICCPCCAQTWVEGGVHSGAPVFADVRDVARAHVLAAETPSASGRYIVAGSHSTPASEISAALQVRRWAQGHGGGGGARGVWLVTYFLWPGD